MTRQIFAIVLLLIVHATARGQSPATLSKEVHGPTVADFSYGTESERQKFDFWKAESDKPTPVVLMIHGGGWVRGDKSGYGARAVQPFLDAGISVAAINYRFIAQAMEQGVEPPVKACVMDAATGLANHSLQSQRVEYRSTARGLDRRLGGGLHFAVARAAR